MKNLIDFVYPNLDQNMSNRSWLAGRAILAPVNTAVYELNEFCLNLIPGEVIECLKPRPHDSFFLRVFFLRLASCVLRTNSYEKPSTLLFRLRTVCGRKETRFQSRVKMALFHWAIANLKRKKT